jgi:hypothetical protein
MVTCSLVKWLQIIRLGCIYHEDGSSIFVRIVYNHLPNRWKVKLSLCLINQALCHETGRIAPQFLTTAQDWGEWSASRPGRFTLEGWVGPRDRLGSIEDRIILPPPGLETRLSSPKPFVIRTELTRRSICVPATTSSFCILCHSLCTVIQLLGVVQCSEAN